MLYLNGNHISNYSQPIHFHYPINRRLGSRVASDSTISSSLLTDRPSRVRVSLYESGRPGSIVSPETPEPLSTFNNNNNNNHNNNINCCSSISRIVNPQSSVTSNYLNHNNINNNHHQQQSISHSTLLSTTTTVNHPNHNHSHHHHNQDHPHQQLTLDLVKMMERKVSIDSGIENPFRPGGELSREAETIVNLIKEGKPITPTTPTKEISSEELKILNGISSSSSSTTTPTPMATNNQILSPNNHLSSSNGGGKLTPTTGLTSTSGLRNSNHLNDANKQSNNKTVTDSGKVYPETTSDSVKLNGSSKIMLVHTTGNGASSSPGIVEVERSIVKPTEPPKADIVTIKKQKKCICCVVQ